MAPKSPEEEHPRKAFGWAARDTSAVLAPFNFSRRNNGEKDVTIKILYCGICHSDLHVTKNELGIPTQYPVVPGHEVVGVVTEVGSGVTKFKVGDKAGIGPTASSCRSCESCLDGNETYCPESRLVFNSTDRDGTKTYGGFSDAIVVDEHFALRFPERLPLDGGAPLLCAGVTVYSPMKYFGLHRPGLRLGVVGLGGLGHIAVKFAKAFGVHVTVVSTSPGKKREAIDRLGADSFLVSRDPDQMKAAKGTMDGIIDTVSGAHPLGPLIDLLRTNGKLVMLGATDKPLSCPLFLYSGGGRWWWGVRPVG
ncbi:hypothetical protein H6P81_020304 [Aristolochia fimbriata]|uniref:Enoyl reductase (ER) domain-containing protein n=1 Tax=Aristolochia fimbriata TaxID=158543 RepID=A0AAV7DVY0_ARIFI|nr:hypothetical protein H6P81_020304 [Aristolochia fimbriata]